MSGCEKQANGKSKKEEMSDPLRMAVVGVGWAGSHHVEGARELGGKVEVSCLVDSDPDHLRTKAEEYGVAGIYSDLDEALSDPEIDAVSLCTPHAQHCDEAIASAGAGKHVLVEKPMALTVEEATRMIDAADNANVKLYVAESAVYHPMARFLKHVVQSGLYIGEVVSASVSSGFRARPTYSYSGRRQWLSEPGMGGTGTWMLQGIHTMAGLRYALGEVSAVYMREHHASSFGRDDVEGTMAGTLSMEAGFQTAVLHSCEVKFPTPPGGYVLFGDRGTLRATEASAEAWSESNDDEREELSYPKRELSGFAQEIEDFADYVTSGKEGPTTGASERRSLAIVQAGYESAASGEVVDLGERFGEI